MNKMNKSFKRLNLAISKGKVGHESHKIFNFIYL